MKSVITEAPVKSEFPKLMKNLESDNIFLLTSERVGTLVGRGSETACKVGEHGTSWNPDADVWEDFEGTITLSND